MSWSLFDKQGQRKYLTSDERDAFIRAASTADDETRLFCLTLALTGARISEVLGLSARHLDAGTGALVFQTLKRRTKGIFRAVPVPAGLIEELDALARSRRNGDQRIWPWCRTTAWLRVKMLMLDAGVREPLATPRALRHAFGVGAAQQKIVLSLIQRWLGHAKIETTAIYATPIGEEERALARLMWDASAFKPGAAREQSD